MSITNDEVAAVENVTHLCVAMNIITNRIHMRALTEEQRRSLNLAVDRLREIERELSAGIDVRP